MFEPAAVGLECGMIARSHHLRSNIGLKCNVVNAGEKPLTLKAGLKLGTACEAVDEANIQFDWDVSNYKELDVVSFKKLALSRHVPNSGDIFDHSTHRLASKSSSLTTQDVFKHEILVKFKEMRTGKTRTLEERQCLLELVLKYNKAFQWNSDEVGHTNLATHSVPTGDAKPVTQKQYPIPTVAKEPCREQVESMLKRNIIRPSNSPWRSPILLVKKKTADKSVVYRFCIDLKKVNDVTIKDSYSLPLISETVDALSGAKYFSTLDVDQAFWQIGVEEADKEKLAFVFEGKLYEFNVMPFGSMNAPSTFQRLIDRVFKGLTWKQCLVYIDDVLIFSKTFDQHLKDIDEVLSRFQFAGLKLKPSKCMFANDEVEYLGFKITKDGIQMTPAKIESILQLQPPETNKKLYGFLCSMNYYRSLIPRFGELTAELYSMAENRAKTCKWTPDSTAAFIKLKNALVSAPILAFPDFKLPFVVQADASNFGIAAVLLQKFGRMYKPIAFASRKLSETEKRYSTSERELLAITYANEAFEHNIFGRKITFFTDHKPLVTMAKLKKPFGRLGRLFYKLVAVDYTLEHIAGLKNVLPDFLSRAFVQETKEVQVHLIQVQSSIDWQVEQLNDGTLAKIINLVRNNAVSSNWNDLYDSKRWLRERKNLYLDDGVLKHGSDKIVCPDHMKTEICKQYHDSPLAGHRAAETTINSILQRFYWNYLPTEVTAYCRSCRQCQTFNYSSYFNKAPLKPILVTRPWQLIGIDFMGPFVCSARGNVYIILAIDHFTKFAVGAATVSCDAQTTAQFLLDEIICKIGMFESVLSDQGVNFESHMFKHLCTLLATDKLHTTTYHSMGNGGIERLNKNIKPNLAKFVNSMHTDWDTYLQLAISAYNSSVHSTIGMTPFEANTGRPAVRVAEVLLNNQLPASTKMANVSDFVVKLRETAHKINQILLLNTRQAQFIQKKNYDRFIRDKVVFKVGDAVKINNCRKQVGLSKAFNPKWLGPYIITSIKNDLTYILEADDLKSEIVHYNRLVSYFRRPGQIILSIKRSIVAQVPTKPFIPYYQASESMDSDPFTPIIDGQTLIHYRNVVSRRKSKEKTAEQHRIEAQHADEVIFQVATGDLDIFQTPARRMIAQENMIIRSLQTIAQLSVTTFEEIAARLRLNRPIILAIEEAPHTLVVDEVADHVHQDQAADQVSFVVGSSDEDEVQETTITETDQQSPNRTYNAAGKRTTSCPNCGQMCESIYGIRVHLRSCRVQNPGIRFL